MTPEQIADCRCDFLTFAKTMFKSRKGTDMLHNQHMVDICNHLERVVLGDINRLVINIPPRSGKTELAVINFMAWSMGLFPDSEFIHASYSKRLATNNTFNTRAVMQDEEYLKIFPWTTFRHDSNAKDEFRTGQGGVMYATGADGTITGYGAGKMRDSFGGCFAFHQKVKTEVGDVAIGDIVNGNRDVRVWSYNEDTKRNRLSRVVNYWNNPANDIIRITMSDGSFIDCTPDHEILTDAGWVSAIHFAKALNLVNAESSQSSGLTSCNGSVISDFNDAFRVLWLCIPLGVREILRDRFPSLAGLDLADNANTNAVTLCEDGSVFGALEYFNSLFPVEFGSGAALEEWERPVPDSVLHVIGLSAIREIAQVVVGGVSVQMANLIPVGAFTYKLLSDKVRDVFGLDDSANGETDTKVTLPITRRLKKSDGLCPADLSGVRNLVQPEGSGNVFPVGVYYAGHTDATYCLEMEGDNNFILSQNGAVVSNCIIIDDPHKAGEATSVVRRTNVIDWFTTTMESRKNRPDTPIIVIMQRLHEEDLAGWLLAGGNGEKWTHLNIPAELENGDSFWPRQFPIDDLKRKEASNPYVYAGQYLQRPAPIGGGLFRDEWWKYWRVEPIIEYKMIYADTAMKTGQENDYSVFQCWGMGRDGNIYLLDQLRGKWEAPQLLINAQSFFNKHNQVEWSPLRQMKVEDKASGTGLIQQMSQNGIPVVGIQRNRDKITRAYDVAPMIEAGRVYLPEDADFLSEFLLESTQFPNGAHDDQLDPMMDAINDLLIGDAEQSFAFLPNRLM